MHPVNRHLQGATVNKGFRIPTTAIWDHEGENVRF